MTDNTSMVMYEAELQRMNQLPYYDSAKKEQYLRYKTDHSNESWTDVITGVNIGLNHAFYENMQDINNPDCLTVLVNKYRRLSESYIPSDLEPIEPSHSPERLLLRHEARLAFEAMCHMAAKEGISLKAVSTFRSYYYQWKVYLKNISQTMPIGEYQKERDKVSARPGSSEHQTGMAVDINELEQTFEAAPEGIWLAVNSWKSGFILRYPKGKEHITGYAFEPWHFRYMGKELAEAVYLSDLTYDEFHARYFTQSD